MELKNIYGNVIFALETARTIAQLVRAALDAKKSLSGADLYGADLSGADLYGADLSRANLYGADLSRANLYGANLSRADLSGADLYGANLSRANLYGANLSRANLYGANLSRANLSRANLSGANLEAAKNAERTLAQIQFIPTEGAFIGWKKCRDGAIVKLGISASAQRSHGSERKCRCSKAKTLAIWDKNGKPILKATSTHDASFVYEVGKVIVPKNGFDEDRWNTCGSGIHFFLTRLEAEAYS